MAFLAGWFFHENCQFFGVPGNNWNQWFFSSEFFKEPERLFKTSNKSHNTARYIPLPLPIYPEGKFQ
jgi:hypothetical protein